jgi:hypothetical protein
VISNQLGEGRRLLALSLCGLLICGHLVGCGSPPPPGPPQQPTFPVQGIVTVDGTPVEGLEVSCHDAKLIATGNSVVATAYTDAEGKFQLSYYKPGDGLPEGNYSLTFLWGEFNLLSRSYGGPDKLKNRYSSAKDSKVTFTSKRGSSVDLKTIELTTK